MSRIHALRHGLAGGGSGRGPLPARGGQVERPRGRLLLLSLGPESMRRPGVEAAEGLGWFPVGVRRTLLHAGHTAGPQVLALAPLAEVEGGQLLAAALAGHAVEAGHPQHGTSLKHPAAAAAAAAGQG